MSLMFRRSLAVAAVVAVLGLVGRMDYADRQADAARSAELGHLRGTLPHATPRQLCFSPGAFLSAATSDKSSHPRITITSRPRLIDFWRDDLCLASSAKPTATAP